jgi:ABC-type sugar transport system permease subunit
MELSKTAPVSLPAYLLRIFLLGIFTVIAIYLAITLGGAISPLFGIGIAIFAIITNVVFLDERFYAWRWIIPAFTGMALLIIYPIGYSVVVAFSNYGSGNILSKEQVVQQFENTFYSPAEAATYQTYIFRSNAGDFRFWFVGKDGKTYVGGVSEPIREVPAGDTSFGERDGQGIPKALGDYVRITGGELGRVSQRLNGLEIDAPPNKIRITRLSLLGASTAAEQRRKYDYDEATNTLTDLELNKVYREERGNFVFGEGETREKLEPGFAALIGLDNILRVVRDANVRDPFFRVFGWTVLFALGSVVSTFALGLIFAIVLNSKELPLRPLWRSLLIIPYAVPFWLSVQTWRGLLNPIYGPVNFLLQPLNGGQPIQFFADPGLAKLTVLFVNLYLGFPYMMLISLGALQSIPSDMYEAALIDGANDWEQFRFITLPMILLAVGPLLIASFAFNFNNFTVIELINNGGPPISAATAAGHTDILLSYTYRLAFSGSRGADYGFAAAIGIFIFLIVGTITLFNFRFTRQLEEVSKNV